MAPYHFTVNSNLIQSSGSNLKAYDSLSRFAYSYSTLDMGGLLLPIQLQDEFSASCKSPSKIRGERSKYGQIDNWNTHRAESRPSHDMAWISASAFFSYLVSARMSGVVCTPLLVYKGNMAMNLDTILTLHHRVISSHCWLAHIQLCLSVGIGGGEHPVWI